MNDGFTRAQVARIIIGSGILPALGNPHMQEMVEQAMDVAQTPEEAWDAIQRYRGALSVMDRVYTGIQSMETDNDNSTVATDEMAGL